jgi:hypothetical protein
VCESVRTGNPNTDRRTEKGDIFWVLGKTENPKTQMQTQKGYTPLGAVPFYSTS